MPPSAFQSSLDVLNTVGQETDRSEETAQVVDEAVERGTTPLARVLELTTVLHTAGELVVAASDSLKTLLFDTVFRAVMGTLSGGWYVGQASMLASSFAYALMPLPGLLAAWIDYLALTPGAGMVEWLATYTNYDKLGLYQFAMRRRTFRYGVAYDIIRWWETLDREQFKAAFDTLRPLKTKAPKYWNKTLSLAGTVAQNRPPTDLAGLLSFLSDEAAAAQPDRTPAVEPPPALGPAATPERRVLPADAMQPKLDLVEGDIPELRVFPVDVGARALEPVLPPRSPAISPRSAAREVRRALQESDSTRTAGSGPTSSEGSSSRDTSEDSSSGSGSGSEEPPARDARGRGAWFSFFRNRHTHPENASKSDSGSSASSSDAGAGAAGDSDGGGKVRQRKDKGYKDTLKAAKRAANARNGKAVGTVAGSLLAAGVVERRARQRRGLSKNSDDRQARRTTPSPRATERDKKEGEAAVAKSQGRSQGSRSNKSSRSSSRSSRDSSKEARARKPQRNAAKQRAGAKRKSEQAAAKTRGGRPARKGVRRVAATSAETPPESPRL